MAIARKRTHLVLCIFLFYQFFLRIVEEIKNIAKLSDFLISTEEGQASAREEYVLRKSAICFLRKDSSQTCIFCLNSIHGSRPFFTTQVRLNIKIL